MKSVYSKDLANPGGQMRGVDSHSLRFCSLRCASLSLRGSRGRSPVRDLLCPSLFSHRVETWADVDTHSRCRSCFSHEIFYGGT